MSRLFPSYSDSVRIASTPEEYVAAVRATLASDNSDRLHRGLAHAQQKTWEAIVRQMEELLQAAEARNGAA